MPDVLRAILAVATAIGESGIAKGRRNQQQGYNFRGIDDIYNALIRSIRGLAFHLAAHARAHARGAHGEGGGALFYVTVTAEFDFTASADGSFRTVRTYGEAMDAADKATNKAMSAAYKYAVMQTFAIPTEGDNDADAATQSRLPRKGAHNPQAASPTLAGSTRRARMARLPSARRR